MAGAAGAARMLAHRPSMPPDCSVSPGVPKGDQMLPRLGVGLQTPTNSVLPPLTEHIRRAARTQLVAQRRAGPPAIRLQTLHRPA